MRGRCMDRVLSMLNLRWGQGKQFFFNIEGARLTQIPEHINAYIHLHVDFEFVRLILSRLVCYCPFYDHSYA